MQACEAITRPAVGPTEIPSPANPWFSESEGLEKEWGNVVFDGRNAEKVAKGCLQYPIKKVVGQRTRS
jgi:hypothetical protein